ANLMVAENTGNLINYKGESIPYTCRVYQLEDYYVIFETPEVNFYGRGTQTQASIMAYDMCNIAKTLLIEKEVLLARYSSKEMIVSSKEELSLFETIVPVNGRVDDVLHSFEIEETYQNHEDIDFDNYATDEFNEEDLMP
ncbi:MAG: hypothetical protein HUJ56_02780, partial [Erysipelotrichaceae bacterium]|nr:hypothetical protein [Erysipelotrichaceae bacterium]